VGNLNIGLVLSGGMSKGAYQLGALRAIREYIEPKDVKYISAASIGALNGYAFTSDNLEVGTFMWHSLNLTHNRVLVTTLLRSDFLTEVIRRLSKKEPSCEKMYVPFINLKTRSIFYTDITQKRNEELKDYLTASVAMPAVNHPVMIDGLNLYDGGYVDCIPVHPLMQYNLDYIICIHFDEYNYTFESQYFDNKIVKINFAGDNKISDSIWFVRNEVKAMEEQGYKKAKAIMDFVFADGFENTAKVYEKIEALNAMHSVKIHRTTSEIISDNFDKLKKRLAKKKIIE
jgi:predicted acylesterase/phospholipase RssA